MRFRTLDEWLSWQETLHPREIDLGLDRVRSVFSAMRAGRPARVVITVTGTNGKGSSVAMLASILCAAGYRVGAYTSPHVYRYNERIAVNAVAVSDEALCEAFALVDRRRNGTSLTYFEFGTLAALQIFASRNLDVAILEVGLGGRLDAVNIVDADCALITRVGVDHVEWLGAGREEIGAEKAAIFRTGKPAVCGDADPPQSVLAMAETVSARLSRRGVAFDARCDNGGWEWQGPARSLENLPLPALPGRFQIDNAAGVLMVLESVRDVLPVHDRDIVQGLQSVRLPGRLQVLEGNVQRVFDVAHNPQAAAEVAAYLAQHGVSGKTRLVIGMLDDKDIEGVVAALRAQVDHWYLGGMDQHSRGLGAGELGRRAGLDAPQFASLPDAYRQAMLDAEVEDRVVVTGSFVGVAQVLSTLR